MKREEQTHEHIRLRQQRSMSTKCSNLPAAGTSSDTVSWPLSAGKSVFRRVVGGDVPPVDRPVKMKSRKPPNLTPRQRPGASERFFYRTMCFPPSSSFVHKPHAITAFKGFRITNHKYSFRCTRRRAKQRTTARNDSCSVTARQLPFDAESWCPHREIGCCPHYVTSRCPHQTTG